MKTSAVLFALFSSGCVIVGDGACYVEGHGDDEWSDEEGACWGDSGGDGYADADADADADSDADADADSDADVPAPECAADADCTDGGVCESGRCYDPDGLCQFSHECGSGRTCFDGFCRPRCDDAGACPDGLACRDGVCRDSETPECVADEECSDGGCRFGACCAACGADAECQAGEICDEGACTPDWRPHPFCESDDACAVGHVCREGVCRSPCASENDCARFDVAFAICGEDGLCWAENELDPECARAVECGDAEHCVDAICRNE